MPSSSQDHVIESYRKSFLKYGDSPEAVQWSKCGQDWRFEKLIELASLDNLKEKDILDVGCGLGHLYSHLCKNLKSFNYTGIDIVEEMIGCAQSRCPDVNFECRDIITNPFPNKSFDYVFISGVFNAPVRTDNDIFFQNMIKQAFLACRVGLVFNFTSSYVNFTNEGMNYFDPCRVLKEVLNNLSHKVVLHHHYKNCDTAVLVYR